jgi:hypothetical protein
MTDPGATYEQILAANLQRAIDFLKFAEAKNGALLALASAWVFAGINLESSGKTSPGYLVVGVAFAVVLALFAGLIAMISFLPQLDLPGFLGGKRAGPHAMNLLYFGDVSKLPVKTLEHDLSTRYWPDANGHKPEYIHDLAVQLSVNSAIAMRKMRLFAWGMRLIVLAGIILVMPSIRLAFGSLKSLW